jgi:exodeoxyribonuclease V gamma subunit
LEKRLKIHLRPLAAPLEDNEPLALNRLDFYQLDVALLEKYLREGITPASHYPLLKAAGRLSPGLVGKHQFALLCDEVTAFHARLQPFLPSEHLAAPVRAQVKLANVRLDGALIQGQSWLSYRPADVKAKDFLLLWLQHLFINAATGTAQASVHIGRDKVCQLAPPPDSHALLANLVDLYRRGQRAPLAFFPKSAWSYVEALAKQKPPQEALRHAQKTWEGNQQSPGECEDLYYRRCFAEIPLNAEFGALAEAIYTPLRAFLSQET